MRGRSALSANRLGDYLIQEGRLRPEQLERALETQKLVGGRLGTNLLELGLISEAQLLKALGHLRSTQTVSPSELRATQADVVRMIPAKLAKRYKLVPYLVKGKTIFIASKDPGDPLQEDEIGFLTSCLVRTCIATELRVEIALRRFYRINVDHRFLILGKRLAGAARPAQPAQAAEAAHQPSRPQPPPAVIGTGSFARQDPVPSSSASAAITVPTTPASSVPVARVEAPAVPKPKPKSEPQFIELDDDDLALLRRPADPSELMPTESPSEAAPAPSPVAASADAVPSPQPVAEDEAAEAEAWLEEVAAEEDVADEELGIEERLMRASMALQDAEIRDEIGDALLHFAGAYFERRVLLISRRDRIFGWMGDGEGVELEAVRGVDLEAQKPSVFAGLKDPSSFWLGPLPPLPSNQQLSQALGGAPRDCLVLPVTLRGKVICYLYVDNGPSEAGRGVSGSPVAEMKRLVAKAGLAFEVYILKHKIRVS